MICAAKHNVSRGRSGRQAFRQFSRSAIACVALAVAACGDLPRDPARTLQRVRESGVLRVGAIESRPWLYRDGERAAGVEAELVAGFARAQEATPEWRFMSAPEAVRALEAGRVDIVAGGLTEDDPWQDRAGYTRPWLATGDGPPSKHVMAVPAGENALLVELERHLAAQAPAIRRLAPGGATTP